MQAADFRCTAFCRHLEPVDTDEEPGGILHEGSQVLEKVFAHLRQRQVFKHNIAGELAIPVTELEALVFGLVLTASRGKGGSVIAKKPEPNAPRISLAK